MSSHDWGVSNDEKRKCIECIKIEFGMGKFRTFEQYCTWQLFAVHDISPEVALPLVQKLNAKQHAEALSMLLLAFKNTSVRSSQTLLSPAQPTTIQMLNHVDNLRKSSLLKSCNLFTQDAFIACLVHIQQHCDEASKSRFSDLFAIADDSDDESLSKYTRKRDKPSSLRQASKSKVSSSSLGGRHGSDDSDSDSSSDEDDFKRKRQRKAAPESSDSD